MKQTVKAVLGKKKARHEWERYRARVTDYELEQYFSIL